MHHTEADLVSASMSTVPRVTLHADLCVGLDDPYPFCLFRDIQVGGDSVASGSMPGQRAATGNQDSGLMAIGGNAEISNA